MSVGAQDRKGARPGVPQVGWGIIGTGTIAEHFAQDMTHVPGAFLAAVASRSPDRAAAFVARHGGHVCRDVASLVQDPAVQAIYVASPNATHYAMAEAALAGGKGVLVEKPLVNTVDDAKRLSALAVQQGTFCMEGLWSRFLPVMDLVKSTIQAGSIGRIKRIRADLAFVHPYDPESRFYDPEQGGGSLLDLGVYLVSLSLSFLGYPDRVQGRWWAAPSGVDKAAEMVLSFGAVEAHLTCGFDQDGTNLFMIEGSKGTLVVQPHCISSRQLLVLGPLPAWGVSLLPLGSGPLRLFSKVAKRLWLPGVRRYDCGFDGYGLQFEIAAASQAVAEGKGACPAMSLADSIETLRILEQVRAQPPVVAGGKDS